MAHMIKKTWYADFAIRGIRYRKRSPENTCAGAKAYEAHLRQKLARGEPIDSDDKPTNGAMSFKDFSWQWFEQYVKVNNKPSEQYGKEKILRSSLVPFFGAMPLDQITSERIERYKTDQMAKGVSRKTINNRLTVLGKCLNCANEWHGAPVPRIRLLKCDPPKTDYLTPVECEMLLEHAGGEMRTMILLALRTGMRQGEIRGLQWSSIDWQTRIITVRHSWYDTKQVLVSPKSNRERHIPFNAEIYRLLEQSKKKSGFVFLSPYGEPFTCHRFNYDLEKICNKAGIRKIGWHVLRHTFATELAMKGTPLHLVQALLGHSTISTTMRYSHVAPSALRAAIDLLDPKTVLSPDFGQPAGSQWQQAIRSEIFKSDRP
jgi:integrase